MSAQTVYPPERPASCGKIPVGHLDYDFIEKCKDVKYLEKILGVLRSGEEGLYPHLIKFCESHLEKLNPNSRALRKETPVSTAASLSKDEWSQLIKELKLLFEVIPPLDDPRPATKAELPDSWQTWEEETKNTETLLKQEPMFNDLVKSKIPPVRGSSCFVPLNESSVPKERKNPSKCALPQDYREDKFDVEKECHKIDGNNPPAVLNTGHPEIKGEVDASWLSQQEKLLLANREKNKGNEALRANDYKEAVLYYSRSLSILPTVAAYNNRAQAEISLKHWDSALRDCQQVLRLDPGNKKALLHQATVHNHTGNYQMASKDPRMVLREEPHNTAATELQQKGKKILIHKTEEDGSGSKKEEAQQTDLDSLTL